MTFWLRRSGYTSGDRMALGRQIGERHARMRAAYMRSAQSTPKRVVAPPVGGAVIPGEGVVAGRKMLI